MGLLKSVNDVANVDFYDYRDSPYFNKFEFRARITFLGIRRTYFSNSVDEFKSKIANKSLYHGLTKDEQKEVLANMDSFGRYFEFRDKVKKDKTCSIRVEADTCAIFSNDLQFLLELRKIDPNAKFDITQTQTANLVGVKHFVKEPKHKYRVYLKSQRIPDDFRDKFKVFLDKNPKLVPSPSLKGWLISARSHYWWSAWLSSTHFIDYDDDSTLSYLALMYGECIGRRYKLEKRPEPI